MKSNTGRYQGTYRQAIFAMIALAILQPVAATGAASLTQHDHILTSASNPSLRLRIDPAFKVLPPLKFPIEKLTNAERRIFVDADRSQRVRRLVIMQFETVQAGAAFRFVYPAKPPARFGEQTYRFGAYVTDDVADGANAPGKEAALTRAFLQARGFKLPRLMRVARLARVAAADGTSEVILFYMEDADADYPAGPLAGADEDGDLDLGTGAKQAMFDRMKSVIRPLAG